MRTSTRRDEDDRGFASLQYVLVAALSLWFFAVLANLIVIQYAGSVVRSAADEGARRGATGGGDVTACLAAADEVLGGLLGGSYGRGVTVTCGEREGQMTVVVSGVLEGIVPPVPDLPVEVQATSPLERS